MTNWYKKAQEEDEEAGMRDSILDVTALDLAHSAARTYGNSIRVSAHVIRQIAGLYGLKIESGGSSKQGRELWIWLSSTYEASTTDCFSRFFEVMKEIPIAIDASIAFTKPKSKTNTCKITLEFLTKATLIGLEKDEKPIRRTFSIGTRVRKEMGVPLKGRIIAPFYWGESNDGTFKAPGDDDVPVRWDNGEKGWANKAWLQIDQ